MTAPGSGAVHATALVLGERGLLIRGPSGAGKSTLARRLICRARDAGLFGRLVADDRTILLRAGGRLIARPVPAIAGVIEIRGIGLVRVPHEPACVVSLVVDLEAPPRLPTAAERRVEIAGIWLPRLAAALPEAEDLIQWRIRDLNDTALALP
ncbi:hypothetical protein [Enterovirga sp.]|uniref:HPr kinase/phosphorylase n=1 Tax=Enterovirga sp. TaxID=2026350 RepID=UPI0026250381|nr:hypothetical protein [Enterovirga sp.]MDB5590754.1 HPr kinase [Enterovirga sp.]